MKTLTSLLLVVGLVSLVGCVSKVTETQPGPKPAYQDRVENRYAKSAVQVYDAAQKAVTSFGNVTRAGNVLVATNQTYTVEGEVNGRSIYIRIEEVAPKSTTTVVQVRTSMGGTDLRVAKDVSRQIGVFLE